jgi:hypothetical protein
MSFQSEFNLILDRLYVRRTDKLRHLLHDKHSTLLTLTMEKREDKIGEMEEIVTKALAKKMARKHFKRLVKRKRTWRTKGLGPDEQLKMFRAWGSDRISRKRGKVYVFWRGRECCYVGRTRGRGTRPGRHFSRGWFNGTTRIDVYAAHQKTSIPSLECLAIHHFRPTKNKVRAGKEKGTPKCPLCAVHKKIRTDLRKIYRFR